MADVYSRNVGGASLPRVQATRHFAVDFSGKSGAPALFAIVDQAKGGGPSLDAEVAVGRQSVRLTGDKLVVAPQK